MFERHGYAWLPHLAQRRRHRVATLLQGSVGGSKHLYECVGSSRLANYELSCAMKALVLSSAGLAIGDWPQPSMRDGFARVRVLAAGLNHRDQWIREGKYANIELPVVLGSDACGIVLDAPSSPGYVGAKVIIDPTLVWGDNSKAQGQDVSILGMPSQGTLTEEVVVPVANLYRVPDFLTSEQAAALPMAGVTAYRALMVQGSCNHDNVVLITGIGGGVAITAFSMALATGARVFVTSTSDDKLAKAKGMGASGGVNMKSATWAKELAAMAGPIDLIVDSLGGSPFNELLALARPGGRVVSYGATLGDVEKFNMRRVFWKQLHVVGSTMGTAADFGDMIEFVKQHRVAPTVDSVVSLEEAPAAFDRLKSGQQFGKIVVNISAAATA